MSLATLVRPTTPRGGRSEADAVQNQGTRVYAIAFDMDTDTLQKAYPGPSWNNAYSEIQRVLARHGFTRQ